ncbi:hypothetical protein EJ076_34905 [Mesorhizobium sp. M7D.F.Ca.US.005.01.1.1]|uniref:hypothetical protein n=1 Tax=Mesorhizobium sp. M7D.F.Ca.US.005.01.1.1 TaxID=2493678 RepID=UPI000F7528CF|nr:hypothetical protein [Mesorhizobium sp. M7D.F.Ca.US.005.01.1.1]AZO45907.1 hypothetical protein EJ076_34905 [Mesorhizobium sp. M7D.F.Ca.US.005.01.1.1]
MIDTRNHYRAVPVKNDDCWRVQFRRFFWPFWKTFRWAGDVERAREYAIQHANGETRTTINFGRLPA